MRHVVQLCSAQIVPANPTFASKQAGIAVMSHIGLEPQRVRAPASLRYHEISTPCVWTEACHNVDNTGLCEDKTIDFIDQTSLSLHLFKWPSVGFTIMVYLFFTM